MNNPEISIIVACGNQAQALATTLSSVAAQTYTQWECILVNDVQQPDHQAQSLLEKDRRFRRIEIPEYSPAAAQNAGIKAAKGGYCLFLTAGDSLSDPSALADVFQANSTEDLIYGDRSLTDKAGNVQPKRYPDFLRLTDLIAIPMNFSAVLVKRSLFDRYGMLREDLHTHFDWAFLLKIFAYANITQKYTRRLLVVCPTDATANGYQARQEKYKVLDESFSRELLTICKQHNTLSDFYNQKIFAYRRRFQKLLHQIGQTLLVFLSGYWIYKYRILPLVLCVNKTVRQQKKNPKTIPVIIINFNRLDDLKTLVSFLQARQHQNIVIIDNHSSYPPLLAYYETIKDVVTVERLTENYGHLVLWQRPDLREKYTQGYYIVSDSDIIPNDALPENYVETMMHLLDKNKQMIKVGFALDVSDIPDTFPLKNNVLQWEKRFWQNSAGKDMFFASIDTTFAIYFPKYNNNENCRRGIRMAGNFLAKHKGWYVNPDALTDEEKYYFQTANNSNSWKV